MGHACSHICALLPNPREGAWVEESGSGACCRFLVVVHDSLALVIGTEDDDGSSQTPSDLADELLQSFEVGETCHGFKCFLIFDFV